ncbi:MAG: hypothetical protein ABIS35_04015 [Terracoccus sp.]
MRARHALPYAACLLVLFAAGACGSADPAPAGRGAVASAGAAPSQRIAITITGSTVTPAPSQVDLATGAVLELVVTSDHDDELHAHGFDVEAALTAGRPATVRLVGGEAGVYEVETHEPALTLLTVAVR